MATSDNARQPPDTRWNGRVSITVTLTTGIFLLVLVSVGAVLGVGVWTAQKNTFALLSQNTHQRISTAVSGVRTHLQPASHQAAFVAERLESGRVDIADRQKVGDLLIGALAAAPQIDAVMMIDPGLQSLLAGRNGLGRVDGLTEFDLSRDLIVREMFLSVQDQPVWNPPIWRDVPQASFLSLAHPMTIGGEPAGAIVSVVSTNELSSFLSDETADDVTHPFILYGRNHVLAHPLLTGDYPGRSNAQPLPKLTGFQDPVLAAIWAGDERFDIGVPLTGGTDGHIIRLHGNDYIFIYRELAGFGREPLIVGAYFPAVEVSAEFQRMMRALVAGIAALVIALIAAILLGRRIARPVVRFSEAASQVQTLDLDHVKPLPGSLFKELNDQARAFNAMLQGLHWFELYVPRKIVDRLMHSGENRDALTASRRLTVMFTDIEGFSGMSQDLSAAEVASFLNHHFALIAGCIEAEGGTLDKFIGDSVMAFWGAPDAVDRPEARACRAALAIAEALRRDNRERAQQGLDAVHLRVGIHAGEATVGNIGAPGRVNYTIIGDAVNVGQRLEQLGKELSPPEDDITILISGDVAAGLNPDVALQPAGRHVLKGREGEIEVFRLD